MIKLNCDVFALIARIHTPASATTSMRVMMMMMVIGEAAKSA